MNRKIFMAMSASLFMWAPMSAALADDGRLVATEIETLLAGNTVVGAWSGTPYEQYFDVGEFTMYFPEGGPPDRSKWRVNSDTNQYENWWRMSGWSSYTIVRTDNGFALVNGETLEHFEVLEGQQVSW